MSGITILASSKPFIVPDEIQEYNIRTYFKRIEASVSLWVNEVEVHGWEKLIEELFTMPHIYEISGAN